MAFPWCSFGDVRHNHWVEDVNNSVHQLLISDGQGILGYMDEFNRCLWARLAEDVPDIAAYQGIGE